MKAYVKNHNLGLEVPYRYGSEMRRYLPDFIVLVDDGHGSDDLLHLVVEIKGYRREDAKEKKATMDTYWVPAVNNLGTLGRWAFAELTEIYQIESDFKAKVASAFDEMIARAGGVPPSIFRLDSLGRAVAPAAVVGGGQRSHAPPAVPQGPDNARPGAIGAKNHRSSRGSPVSGALPGASETGCRVAPAEGGSPWKSFAPASPPPRSASRNWTGWATRSPSCRLIWRPPPPASSTSSASSTPAAAGTTASAPAPPG